MSPDHNSKLHCQCKSGSRPNWTSAVLPRLIQAPIFSKPLRPTTIPTPHLGIRYRPIVYRCQLRRIIASRTKLWMQVTAFARDFCDARKDMATVSSGLSSLQISLDLRQNNSESLQSRFPGNTSGNLTQVLQNYDKVAEEMTTLIDTMSPGSLRSSWANLYCSMWGVLEVETSCWESFMKMVAFGYCEYINLFQPRWNRTFASCPLPRADDALSKAL